MRSALAATLLAAAAVLLCAPLTASAAAFQVVGENASPQSGLEWAFNVYLGAAPLQDTRFAVSCAKSGLTSVITDASWQTGDVDQNDYRRVTITLPALGHWTCTYKFENIVQGGNTVSTQYAGGILPVDVLGQQYYVAPNGPDDGEVGTTFVWTAAAGYNPVVATTVFVSCGPAGGPFTGPDYVISGTSSNLVNFDPPSFGTFICKFEPMGDENGDLDVPSAQYAPTTVTVVIHSALFTDDLPEDALIGVEVSIDLTPGIVPALLTDISIVCTGTPFGANAPVVKTAAPAASWDPANNLNTQNTKIMFDQVAQYTCVISFTTGPASNPELSLYWDSKTVIVLAQKPIISLLPDAAYAVNQRLYLFISRDAPGAADVYLKISCGVDGGSAKVVTVQFLQASSNAGAYLDPADDYTPDQPGSFTCSYQIFDNALATVHNTVYGVENEASLGDGIGRLQFSIAGTEYINGAEVVPGAWTHNQINNWPSDQIMLGDVLEITVTLSNDPSTVGAGGLYLTVSANCGGYATVTSPAMWSADGDGLTSSFLLSIDGTGGFEINFHCDFVVSGTAAAYFQGAQTGVVDFQVPVVPSITVVHTTSATGSVLPSSAQSVRLRLGKEFYGGYSLHIAMTCDFYDDSHHYVNITGGDLVFTGPSSLSTEATFTVPPTVADVRCTFARGAAAGGVGVTEWLRMPSYTVLVRPVGTGVVAISHIDAFVARGAFPLTISATLPETVNALGFNLTLTCAGLDAQLIEFAAGTPYNTLQSLSLPQPTRQSTACTWSVAGDSYFAVPSPATFTIQLPAISLTGVTAQSKFVFGSSHVFTFTTNAPNLHAGETSGVHVACQKGNMGNSGVVAALAPAGTQVSFTYIAPNATAGSPDTTDQCTFTVVSSTNSNPFFLGAAPDPITFGLTLTPPIVPQSSSSSTGPSSSSSTGPLPSSSSSSSGPAPSSSGPSSSSSGATAPPATNGTGNGNSTSSSGPAGGSSSTGLPGDFTSTAAGVQSAGVLEMILALVVAVFGAAL